MHDPAAAVGAVYGDRRALDALLPGIGWRDLASIDLVVEIVARPEQAGIHIAQCMADLFVGRDLLPDRQCRMGSVDTALKVAQFGQQGLDPVGPRDRKSTRLNSSH